MYYMLSDSTIHSDNTGSQTPHELYTAHTTEQVSFMWFSDGMMCFAFYGAGEYNINHAQHLFDAWIKEK